MRRRYLPLFGILLFNARFAPAQDASNVGNGGLSFHLTDEKTLAECADPQHLPNLSATLPNIIHYVKWTDETTYTEQWMVSGPLASLPDSKRIFGAKSIRVLAVHMNVRKTADFTYKVDIKQKSPSWLQNLTALLGLGAPALSEARVCKSGYLDLTRVPVPSDITVSATKSDVPAPVTGGVPLPVTSGDKSFAFTQTFDNEGKYWFDFSFGLPVLNQKVTDFQVTNGVLMRKDGSRAAAIGFLNIFPGARDTKDTTYPLRPPHFMVGLPLTGEALHNPVAAMGVTVAQFGIKFDLYAGCAFNRTEIANASGTGTSAHWVRKPTVGLNIPVSQFVTAYLKKK